jgi:geranylgeranyl transferase type-2 subunit beta
MNAVYWGLTALCIMKHKEALDPEETIAYVMSCWDEDAGARRHHSIKSLSLFRRSAR